VTSSIAKAGRNLSGFVKKVGILVVAAAALAIAGIQPAAANDWRDFHHGPHFHGYNRFVFRGAFFPGPYLAPAPVVVAPAPYYGYAPPPVAYAPPPVAYAPVPFVATPSVSVVVPLHIH